MKYHKTVLVILLLFCTACQPNPAPLPSLMPSLPPPTALPHTPTPRQFSTLPPHTPVIVALDSPSPTMPPSPTVTIAAPTLDISPSATPISETRVFGQSVEGRDLIAYRIGGGERAVLLVGAVHGGYESNTVALMEGLAAHFRAAPWELPSNITLWIVPSLNPDGVARGRVLEGRFNANGVDLNRNWPCGWQPVAYFRSQTVNAGASPLSEPETQALADLIIALQPTATLFFHAAAAGVFAGTCGGESGSAALSAVYGEAADYTYGETFSAYPVTGTAPAWVNSLGLAAADVELASATEVELERNLAGVRAALCWASGVTGCGG